MTWRRATFGFLATLLVVGLTAVGLVWFYGVASDESSKVRVSAPTPDLVARGAYLAIAGDCTACHTSRGGARFAGGRALQTPFGTVYSTNLTPDPSTGIGHWSSSDFWNALHNGRSKNGRLLSPVFPFTSYTEITREDSDALYAFLHSLAPVEQENRPQEMRFPFGSQAAIAVWRALFFRAKEFTPRLDKPAEWNRGAYLVRGLEHCMECHATRNALGATTGRYELGGGLIPLQNWYAPSLASASEARVSSGEEADAVRFLKTGTSSRGSAFGPMAEVVAKSTQYLHDEDLRAIVVFLKDLPQSPERMEAMAVAGDGAMSRGKAIYRNRCADCHGTEGAGSAGVYPALAGNRMVTLRSSTNVAHLIAEGGFPPTTQGNPRPYGMPPFEQVLNNAEIADVATYVRNSWGNQAGAVSELDVLRSR